MLTEKQIVSKYLRNKKLVVVTVGDSFTYGFTSNPGVNVWATNGLPYLFTNPGTLSPHADPGSPYYLNSIGYLAQSKQDDVTMPNYSRLLWDHLLTKNPGSVVHNMGISGATPTQHLVVVAGEAGTTPQNIDNLPEKPDVVFIMLGPNSAKNNLSQLPDLETLVAQIQALGIFVCLIQNTNIGVTDNTENSITPNFVTSNPDNWFPKRSNKNTTDEVAIVRDRRNTGWLSCGSTALRLNITQMYDPFHPNPAGHVFIKDRLLNWFSVGTHIDDGSMLKTVDGKKYYQPTNGNQAFKAKLSTAQIVSMPLKSALTQTRIDSGTKLSSFEE